jgi:hypothetical protein
MTKLNEDALEATDVEDYLAGYSDFSFELRVLKEFIRLGFGCQHGGTYTDPVTGKDREFDIRGLVEDQSVRIHLSIECKNIRPNFPLITHCLPRTNNESFNELILTSDPDKEIDLNPVVFLQSTSESMRLQQRTLYPLGKWVAKSTDQVGRRTDGSILATDGGVFDKISQAINSARDLILQAHELVVCGQSIYTLVVPVLVVPEETLWCIKYNENGDQIELPQKIQHISYFIGKQWQVGQGINSLVYTMSHLDIVTFPHIETYVKDQLFRYVTGCLAAMGRGDTLS